jgi:hypothetical protein
MDDMKDSFYEELELSINSLNTIQIQYSSLKVKSICR